MHNKKVIYKYDLGGIAGMIGSIAGGAGGGGGSAGGGMAGLIGQFAGGSGGGGMSLTNVLGGGGGASASPMGMAGKAADAICGFMPLPTEYSGDKGKITQTMDSVYDKASDIAMNIPGAGTIVGGAMKLNKLASRGVKAIGGGTDGMTTADAILGSSFLQMTPLGLINGFGGKKADTFKVNSEILSKVGASYAGTYQSMKDAEHYSGKKYGLFSQGALRDANAKMHEAGRQLNKLGQMAETNDINASLQANQSDIAGAAYANELNGGYDQSAMRAAKHGMKFRKEELFGLNKLSRTVTILAKKKLGGTIEFTPFIFNLDALKEEPKDIQEFKDGGSIGETNVIPEGALHAHKHHMEDLTPELDGQITKKGIPVIVDGKKDGEVEQQAEIERNEIIFRKEVTQQLEDAYKEYKKDETSQEKKDELAITIGKLLTEEIINNTEDRTGLLKTVE